MNEIVNQNFSLRLDEDGITRLQWAPQTDVTLELAQAVVLAISKLTGGKPCPLLVEMTNVRSMEREARIYFASGSGVTAVALNGGSLLVVTISNFFIHINKPKNPTRLFAAEAEALAWLKGYL